MGFLVKLGLIIFGFALVGADDGTTMVVGVVMLVIGFSGLFGGSGSKDSDDEDEGSSGGFSGGSANSEKKFLRKEIRAEESYLRDLKAKIDGRSFSYGYLDLAGKVELKAMEREYAQRKRELDRMKRQYRHM